MKSVQKATTKNSDEAVIASLNEAVEKTLAATATLRIEAKPHIREPK